MDVELQDLSDNDDILTVRRSPETNPLVSEERIQKLLGIGSSIYFCKMGATKMSEPKKGPSRWKRAEASARRGSSACPKTSRANLPYIYVERLTSPV